MLLLAGQMATSSLTSLGCASWTRNLQITPFCHRLGRHPTILHNLSRKIRRILVRISPDRSPPLNLNFFSSICCPQNAQNAKIWTCFRKDRKQPWRAWQFRPIGAQGGPWGPLGGHFRSKWGPMGGPWVPPTSRAPRGADAVGQRLRCSLYWLL